MSKNTEQIFVFGVTLFDDGGEEIQDELHIIAKTPAEVLSKIVSNKLLPDGVDAISIGKLYKVDA